MFCQRYVHIFLFRLYISHFGLPGWQILAWFHAKLNSGHLTPRADGCSNYDEVPARLIKIKYITIRVEKVASPTTALQSWIPKNIYTGLCLLQKTPLMPLTSIVPNPLLKTFAHTALIDWVRVLHPTQNQIAHFGDALLSQFLGLLIKQN